MSYDEEEVEEEKGFRLDDGDDELDPMGPLEIPDDADLGLGDDDPDNRYH